MIQLFMGFVNTKISIGFISGRKGFSIHAHMLNLNRAVTGIHIISKCFNDIWCRNPLKKHLKGA